VRPSENAVTTFKIGIDQGANLKTLKRLQERGIIVLYQAYNLEGWRSQVIQQECPFRVGVSKVVAWMGGRREMTIS
jgi:hypothetical protein